MQILWRVKGKLGVMTAQQHPRMLNCGANSKQKQSCKIAIDLHHHEDEVAANPAFGKSVQGSAPIPLVTGMWKETLNRQIYIECSTKDSYLILLLKDSIEKSFS